MSYRVNLIGEGEVLVDDTTGIKIKDFIASGKRGGYFQANGGMYQVRDVKFVAPVRDIKSEQKGWNNEQINKDRDYDAKLGRLSKESAKEKAEREIRVRIKPMLKKVSLAVDIKDLFKHIYIWFEKNPKYPWCPLDVWLEYGFGSTQVFPYYTKLIVNHDRRVYRWLEEENEISKEVDPYQILNEPLAYTMGGDLDG